MSLTKYLILFLLLFTSLAFAGRERIDNIQVEIINDEILASFELKEGFNRKIERDIHDGIEKDFYYYVLLNQKHENWFDEEIVARTIRYTVKYDTLKKSYTVRRQDEMAIEEQVFDRIEAMRAFVSAERRFPVAMRSYLEHHHRYFLRVKAQMKASHVPLYLDRFLFFIPFLELDTPWTQSLSIYAETIE
jgi:hypothetical protein